MEITLAWFWLIKLIIGLLPLGTLYMAARYHYKHDKFSKMWMTITVILMVLVIFSPVKINGTMSVTTSVTQNNTIANSKELPSKVVNTEFSDAVKNIKEINTSFTK